MSDPSGDEVVVAGHRFLAGSATGVLATLEPGSVQCCVTSPPYFQLRSYGEHPAEIGVGAEVGGYVESLVEVFRSVRRVLADDGVLWLNLGDSYSGSGPSGAAYQSATTRRRADEAGLGGRGLTHAEKRPVAVAGLKKKDLVGIPWRVALALQDDGWWLRSDVIWSKPNPMPESVRDRPTRSHEYVFLLSKRARYRYDADAIAEPVIRGAAGSSFLTGKTGVAGQGRASVKERVERRTKNVRSVWSVATTGYDGAHFAVMPEALASRCIRAGSRRGDVVLDPFGGAGTVALAADRLGRGSVYVDLYGAYRALAVERLVRDRRDRRADQLALPGVEVAGG